nr:MAG TPA: hypothetical protein [Caudoviricetes sp.]
MKKKQSTGNLLTNKQAIFLTRADVLNVCSFIN